MKPGTTSQSLLSWDLPNLNPHLLFHLSSSFLNAHVYTYAQTYEIERERGEGEKERENMYVGVRVHTWRQEGNLRCHHRNAVHRL